MPGAALRYVVVIESTDTSARTWESAATWPDAQRRAREIESSGTSRVADAAIVANRPVPLPKYQRKK